MDRPDRRRFPACRRSARSRRSSARTSTPAPRIVAIDRHRNDDFKPYIFLTTDYGETWKPLANNLPPGAVVGVVRQSSKDKDLLFAGTELGLYVSLDGGKVWHHLDKTGLPKGVRVDDLVIHPRERELVIGTHGRGIWVMDIAPLEQLTEKVLTADAHLFDVKPVTLLKKQDRPEPAAKARRFRRGRSWRRIRRRASRSHIPDDAEDRGQGRGDVQRTRPASEIGTVSRQGRAGPRLGACST